MKHSRWAAGRAKLWRYELDTSPDIDELAYFLQFRSAADALQAWAADTPASLPKALASRRKAEIEAETRETLDAAARGETDFEREKRERRIALRGGGWAEFWDAPRLLQAWEEVAVRRRLVARILKALGPGRNNCSPALDCLLEIAGELARKHGVDLRRENYPIAGDLYTDWYGHAEAEVRVLRRLMVTVGWLLVAFHDPRQFMTEVAPKLFPLQFDPKSRAVSLELPATVIRFGRWAFWNPEVVSQFEAALKIRTEFSGYAKIRAATDYTQAKTVKIAFRRRNEPAEAMHKALGRRFAAGPHRLRGTKDRKLTRIGDLAERVALQNIVVRVVHGDLAADRDPERHAAALKILRESGLEWETLAAVGRRDAKSFARALVGRHLHRSASAIKYAERKYKSLKS